MTIDVKALPYRAMGDGVTDDRAAIQAAIDDAARRGGGRVFLPKGVYVIGPEPGSGALGGLRIRDKVTLQGEAAAGVVLRLMDGADRHLIYGPENADALWETDSSDGVGYWSLRDLQLDGNRARNRTGSGIWIYGYKPLVENLFIRDVAGHAWRTGWGDAGPVYGMEGTITNLHIDTCGGHGVWFSGPHDSILTNVIVIDASQSAHAGHDAFHLTRSSASRFIACHAWTRSNVTHRKRHALFDGVGSNDFIACQFEGAYGANVVIDAQGVLMDGCRIFAAGNGVNLLVKGTENVIRNTILSDRLAGAPPVRGIVLGEAGDWVSACDIDIYCRGQEAGAVDFTHSAGANCVRIRGYNPSGIPYVGIPPGDEDVDIYISGAGGGTLRRRP